MLFGKNKAQTLAPELFKQPTAEYRGAPFWSWNTKLDPKEAVWQADVFKQMGFGGYHMHSRSGLASEYLGEDFNSTVKACVKYAKENDMLAWLYDEDRWPSGFAGGKVTKNKAYRQRYLLFTNKKIKTEAQYDDKGRLTDGVKLLASYKLDKPFGKLRGYKRLAESGKGRLWRAYLCITEPSNWYGKQTYVDTLNKEAIDCFARITYDKYKELVGAEFGKTVPAIFTDEPQIRKMQSIASSFFSGNAIMPWTDDFGATYNAAYGEDVLDSLPELFFERADGAASLVRYRYYAHLTERFAEAYADNLGARCDDMGIMFTGHLMQEPSLQSQSTSLGCAMRHYKGFAYPGIDILCNRHEYNTAKQAQSVARQYGREGMISELYGVSRWDADFRRFKEEGDWQAAFGVSTRVPHLSMMSMKGAGKRDYPPSIFYQSSWYEKFGVVEDHFARLNTALTRGKPIADIAVIHPIESFWLDCGADDMTKSKRIAADKRFEQLTSWLIFNNFDFDFIDESLFPMQCEKGGNPLCVGKMAYKTVIVPALKTIRASTLQRLEEFAAAGGKLIFMGGTPKLVDAKPSDKVNAAAENAINIGFDKGTLLPLLEESRIIRITDAKGADAERVLSLMRRDNDCTWLYLTAPDEKNFGRDEYKDSNAPESYTLKIKGDWYAERWDTLSGEIYSVDSSRKDGYTYLNIKLYHFDSLLYRLTDAATARAQEPTQAAGKVVAVKDNVTYSLSEPNALLLDRGYYALDGDAYTILKHRVIAADTKASKKLGVDSSHSRNKEVIQPWLVDDKATHTLKLKFVFYSEIQVEVAYIALEGAESAQIVYNGVKLTSPIDGWYTDKEIKKRALPGIRKGKNIVEVAMTLGEADYAENCFILGDFGVKLCGTKEIVTALPATVNFGDLVSQGFPFYGGKFTYHTSFESNGGNVELQVPLFRAGLVTANGKDIAYPPFKAALDAEKGLNKLDVTAYLSRNNAFGTIHAIMGREAYYCSSPTTFLQPALCDTERYVLVKQGVLSAPTVTELKPSDK